MNYTLLTQFERDLEVARAIHAREAEYYNYELNVDNYRNMIDEGIEDKDFRTQLEKGIVDSLVEMKKVEQVHSALLKQLPAGERRDLAYAEVTAEMEKRKNASLSK